jgi:hypothetical protein
MFMRYIGGGIGHLEQFPPANNDSGVTYEYKDEGEMDVEGSETGDTGGKRGDENEEDEDDGIDNGSDGDAGENGECSDPGESSDEDMGNTY